MTTKCVNPSCGVPFRYLRGGKLFLVDRPPSGEDSAMAGSSPDSSPPSEFFWLCEICCKTMHVILDKGGAVVVKTLERKPAASIRAPEEKGFSRTFSA